MNGSYFALSCLTAATLFLFTQAGRTDTVRTPHQSVMYHAPVPPPTVVLIDEKPIIPESVVIEVTPQPTPAIILVVPTEVVRASNISLYDAVLLYFPEQPDKAYKVFYCESRGIPSIVSPNGRNVGVAQQDVLIWGYPPSDVFGQVQKAREIYLKAGGWGPWPVCGFN